jgi:hypothetical protein
MKSKMILVVLALVVTAFLSACGGGGQGGDSSVNPPSNDKTPPEIKTKTPDNNDTGVALDESIVIVWNEKVKAVTTDNLEVKEEVAGTVLALKTPTTADKTTTFKTASDFKGSTKYRATLKNVSDESGNLFASISWTFTTTSSSGSAVKPKIVDWTPIQGAVNVPRDINPSATFNKKNIDSASLTGNVKMTADGVAVPGSFALSEGVVTFTATGGLLPASAHIIYSIVNAKDTDGNQMDGDFALDFHTGTTVGTLAMSTFYGIMKNGAATGHFDPATGISNVLVDGLITDAAAAKKPMNIVTGKKYQAKFACASIPANLPIQLQLKQDVSPWQSYATVNTTCNGGIVTANFPVTDHLPTSGNDPAARFAINHGLKAGKYDFGDVFFIEVSQ